jgi:glycosyltransferase involved in cell wall biosynthesis
MQKHGGEHVEVKVSIVIPSYNRYPQNRLSLYSLQYQTVPYSMYEVILIDGGSDDGTMNYMQKYHPPYAFQYVRIHHRINRSATRNQGIYRAKGEIIIFLDAEVIVQPDFIEKHLSHHQMGEKIVVSGAMKGYQLYSTIEKTMSDDQLKQLYSSIRQSPKYLKRCGIRYVRTCTFRRFLQRCRANPQPYTRLFTHSDIRLQKYRQYAIPHGWVQMLFAQFGNQLHGFAFPWMMFVTRNVSVHRNLLNKAGYFDENYQGFGHEDFDLGFRLHLAGAKFIYDVSIPYYHQEHFMPAAERGLPYLNNVIYFIDKYPCMEVKMFVVMGLLQINNLMIHHTWLELQALQTADPEKGIWVQQTIEYLFGFIIEFARTHKPLSAVSIQAGITPTHSLRKNVTQVVTEFQLSGQYTHLCALLQMLMYR